MTLIKSISGIRGTIGGRAGDTLNPRRRHARRRDYDFRE